MQKESWLTMVPSHSIKMQNISGLKTFHSCSLVFIHVPLEFVSFDSCSSVFTHVLVVFIRVHPCSTLFYWCSLVFIHVNQFSFVFIRRHWCSFMFHSRSFVWCFRLDQWLLHCTYDVNTAECIEPGKINALQFSG